MKHIDTIQRQTGCMEHEYERWPWCLCGVGVDDEDEAIGASRERGMERGFARGFDDNQHHSRDWDEASGNQPGQAAPSILGRLKKVLSSVRGGSGRDRKGRRHSQASSASGYVVHAADAGELAIEPDRKIYERVLSQLDR